MNTTDQNKPATTPAVADITAPVWKSKIYRMINEARQAVETAQATFEAYTAKHGLLEAMKWRGAEISEAAGAFKFFARIEHTMLHGIKIGATDKEIATEVLKRIDEAFDEALNEARRGHNSTSPFHNVVETAFNQGMIGALRGSFGSGGDKIKYVIDESGVMND